MMHSEQCSGPVRFNDDRDWFFEKRFGLFVHWGLYAIPAWHEQIQWRKRMDRNEYARLAEQWNPTAFSPDAWLDLMEEAGMEYICLTTKHHDGFCLWDTTLTDFNTMNTPYGRDIVGMLAEACHRRGVPLCLYYSIVDWYHRNYPNQGRHHELPGPLPGDAPDWDRYMAFLKAQVRELCTRYGIIHGIWWDMNVPGHRDPSVHAMIRALQPAAVINNRGFDTGDFDTPEREYRPDTAAVFTSPTEACQSVGMESWGFRKDEDYYSNRHLITSIDRYLARGANYLLNVGPDAQGRIPERSAGILRRIGRWYKTVKASLTDAKPAPGLVADPALLITRRANTLYVHIPPTFPGDGVRLKPIDRPPRRAILLNDGRTVDWSLTMAPSDHVEQKAFLRLRGLPINTMPDTVLVVKLDFDDLPRSEPGETAAATDILRQ